MADPPDGIVLRRHRELQGPARRIWPRRALIGLLVVLSVLGLANVFGQRPQTIDATAPAATLKVYAPARVRSGLLYEARFTIRANDDLKSAALLLSPGWGEGQSMNTIEPSPVGQGSHDGKLVLELGHVPAGEKYVLFMQFQVNPTNVGRRSQNVALYDGNTRILAVHRRFTVFP